MSQTRQQRQDALHNTIARSILVLDGAMGTEIQALGFAEADFRGARFVGHDRDLKGNNDLLTLTQPDAIRRIHGRYFAAGADIVATNTFNATTISQADYGTQDCTAEINRRGAELAREAAEQVMAEEPGRVCFVAGAIGPTNRTCSISPDVNDPGYRATSFDEMRDAYGLAARNLVAGGVDLLLIETVFDTLNAKAALFAIDELFEEIGERLPVIVSGTITDRSGRTLSGQTVAAFWNSIRHARPFAVGLNCSLGADELRAYVGELSQVADAWVCAYPNAGLPNEFGEYDETPEETSGYLGEWALSGLVNIVGGCCGTTPDHIRAIAARVAAAAPRERPAVAPWLRLSGLEAFELCTGEAA
jgi:5-methyltetrahydrofolate--homocysteine methyltransferase